MKKTKLFMAAACALAIALPAAGQQGDDSPIVSGNVNPALKAPITLRAHEASLSDVLRVLAERSGMNFVVGEGVQREKITIILNNTPLDESVNLLVRASGLSYEIIGNSILIAEPDKLKEDVGMSSYVVELKYAKAEEVAAALSDLTKSVKIDKGGNRLICYASPRVIMEVERIVKAIDKPHILVLLETRLIEVNMNKLNQYGFNWNSLSGAEGNAAYVGSSIKLPEAPIKDAFNFSNALFGEISVNMVIDLMIQNGDGRILMDSKLTTTNNREASLHIGEIVPYVIQSYNLAGAGGENQQIEKENVGVMLSMTPHINDKNQITLNLTPEVSNVAYWQNNVPVVKTRKTTTTVRVESGQTVILAGLLSEEQVTNTHKFPILGDIPVLGLLFQNRRNEVKKTNLIIEVVPRIISDPAEISKYMTMQMEGIKGSGKGKRGKHRDEGGHRQSHGRPAEPPAQPQPVAPIQPAIMPQPVVEQPAAAYPAAQPVPAQPAPAYPAAAQPAPAQPAPTYPATQPAPAQPAPAYPAAQPIPPQPAAPQPAQTQPASTLPVINTQPAPPPPVPQPAR